MPGLFEVLGPIMIGPSSSHTAGAVRLGNVARSLLDETPSEVRIWLHGSFAATYQGHGTDLALVGGLLGFSVDDDRLKKSFEYAKEQGMKVSLSAEDLGDVHPNSVKISLVGINGGTVTLTGSSVGGGRVEVFDVDGLPVSFSGEKPTMLVQYQDRPGIIAGVTSIFADMNINIATMKVSRQGRGKSAIAVIEADEHIPDRVTESVRAHPGVGKVVCFTSK
ncbi:MAG: L-serine ammonia-lyase, iron-sulfur-dependent, subunit beta [Firmicutes bacterium]|jgi:L-serine dehydratase|nr:L-serine ammonia-lyase, iron-sulfur-dependent subunit beta [Candidatus Fermentithermobacillaceae bacterium]NLA07133.1 L-serine ammonia-lyase, iron-sulfur-dependent, subunit beta [Bacillota bacterium]